MTMPADNDADEVERLISALWNNPRALLNLATTLLLPRRLVDQVHRACDRALALSVGDGEVVARIARLRGRVLDPWYFSMVQDETRHACYAAALARVVRPNSIVLDLGSGTGLFAMLAARAGAEKVVGCERNVWVARDAQRTIAANGLSEQVSIVALPSSQLELGTHLPRPADVILWDNLSNNLLGVGGGAALEEALWRLGHDQTVVLPDRVEIRAALAADLMPRDRAMTVVHGFDMSPFLRLRRSDFTIRRSEVRLQSTAATVFDIEARALRQTAKGPSRGVVTARAGKADGIAQWLRFHLTKDIVYDTGAPISTAFGIQFHHQPELLLMDGEAITICGNTDGRDTWFWLDGGS